MFEGSLAGGVNHLISLRERAARLLPTFTGTDLHEHGAGATFPRRPLSGGERGDIRDVRGGQKYGPSHQSFISRRTDGG